MGKKFLFIEKKKKFYPSILESAFDDNYTACGNWSNQGYKFSKNAHYTLKLDTVKMKISL